MKTLTKKQIEDLIFETIYVNYDGKINSPLELEEAVKMTLDVNKLLPWCDYFHEFIEIAYLNFNLKTYENKI